MSASKIGGPDSSTRKSGLAVRKKAVRVARSNQVPRDSIPPPPEVPAVAISSSFSDNVTVIPQSMSSLILGTGRLENPRRNVLLPYVEMRFGGTKLGAGEVEPEDLQTLFSATLPMENAAFLILDLINDFRTLCEEIGELSHGGLAVEPARFAHVRYFMAHAQRQTTRCLAVLDELTEQERTGSTEES